MTLYFLLKQAELVFLIYFSDYPFLTPRISLLLVPNILVHTFHMPLKISTTQPCLVHMYSNYHMLVRNEGWEAVDRTGCTYFDKATGYDEGSTEVKWHGICSHLV